MRIWILAAFAVVLVAGGAAVAALLAWPTAGIASSTTGLATVSLPGFSGDVQGVSVKGPEGKPLPIGLSHGIVWPHARLAAGDARDRHGRGSPPGVDRLARRAPRRADGEARYAGRARQLDAAAAEARHRGDRALRRAGGPRQGRSHPAAGPGLGPGRRPARCRRVRKCDRRDEDGRRRRPAVGDAVRAGSGVVVRGGRQDTGHLVSRRGSAPPATPGADADLRPAGGGSARLAAATARAGYARPLDAARLPHARLPARRLRLRARRDGARATSGAIARLARSGGVDPAVAAAPRPARLSPAALAPHADPPPTPAQEVAAAVSPPPGNFSWRYPGTPASLQTLWKPGGWNVVTQGAVMRFEDEHGMPTDGVAGPEVWRALLRDDLDGPALGQRLQLRLRARDDPAVDSPFGTTVA